MKSLQQDDQAQVFLTHGYFIGEDKKEQKIMKPYPPLGLLYISAYLEQKGIPNKVFDSTFSDFETLSKAILNNRPAILGVYTNLMTKINVLRIIRFVRNTESLKHTKIILGGPEVRYHIEKFLRYGAHFVIVGEGEESMEELSQFILQKNELTDNTLLKITGIAFIGQKGDLMRSPERLLKRNLDELPMPNRKKINLEKYLEVWKDRHGASTISVSTMRGCPYTCKWCSRAVYGQSYRRRSPKSVVKELQYLQKNYSFDTVWFVDDVFTISHKWLAEFNDEIQASQLKVSYECITRADRLNEQTINHLKESGCYRVWIGAESGSQKILDAMDRRVKADEVQKMIQTAKLAGLETGTFIMVGYPGETETDLEQTITHLKNADPDYYTITLAYPITGTELYTETKDQFLHEQDWSLTTDRDIDFKRTYPRPYYDYAIRRIYNEVSYAKSRKDSETNLLKSGKFKLKALAAKAAMAFSRFV